MPGGLIAAAHRLVPSRFGPRLALAAGLGGLVRVWAVLAHYRELPLGFTDNFFYSVQARAVADGRGFIDPFIWDDSGAHVPNADHPPLYTLYLAAASLVRDGPTAHRLASCLLGVATVVLVGLATRAVALRLGAPAARAERAATVTAVVAAVYPPLWILDATLVAEALYAPLVAGALVLAAQAGTPGDRRFLATFCLLGIVLGLATLTRAEGLTLFGLLAVPVAAVAREVPWRRRIAGLTLCGLAGAAVMAPWVVRNLRTFDEPVLLSVGAGFVLKVGNCDQTYYGDRLGYWAWECAFDGMDEPVDRSVHERRARAQALDYIDDHRSRVPVVVAARIGRLYELYRPVQGIDLNEFFERRGRLPSVAGVAAFYAVGALAVVAVVRHRHRWTTLVGPVSVVIATTLTAATAFGITRYRVGADVALLVLAGVALVRPRDVDPVPPVDP